MALATKPRKTKAEKALEAQVASIRSGLISGVQFDIMDLGKITDAGMEAGRKGEDIEAALKAAVAKYRKN